MIPINAAKLLHRRRTLGVGQLPGGASRGGGDVRATHPSRGASVLRWVLVTSLLGAAISAWALDDRLKISQYRHEVWGHRDGLPSTSVQAIVQTPDGYLWVGTPAGLFRFDGVRFTNVPTDARDPQRKEYIYCLAVSPTGELWLGTRYSGLRHLTAHGFEQVSYPKVDTVTRGLAFNRAGDMVVGTSTALWLIKQGGTVVPLNAREPFITCVSTDRQGNIYIGYKHGFDRFTNETLTSGVDESIFVNAAIQDRQGDMWMAAENALVAVRKGVSLPSTSNGAPSQRFVSIYEDRDGNIWAGAAEGLTRVRSSGMRERAAELLRIGEVLSLCEDREGSFWVGTADGLHRFNNPQAVPWGTPEGLKSNSTPSVNIARDGTVYVMSNAPTGVTRLRDGKLEGLDSIVDGPSYIARDGTLWVGTTAELARVKDGHVDHFDQRDGMLNAWISAIGEDEEGLLLGHATDLGLRRWDGHRTSYYRLRDGSDFKITYHVFSMYSAPDHTIWTAGYDGLWHLDHGMVTRYTTPAGIESTRSWYAEHPQSPTCFKTVVSPDMADFWFNTIADDGRGTMWITSHRGGLTRFRDGKFTTFTTKQGLTTNQLYSVLVDDTGDVWLGSPGGILHLKASELEAVGSGAKPALRCEVFTRSDGLRNDECSATYGPSSAKAPDGTLWFATKTGVVSIDPRHLIHNDLPPPVRIEHVYADGRELSLAGGESLAPDSQKFEFQFTALSLMVPERVRFKYQLVGFDPEWVDGGATRSTQYTRLAPGRYEFRVKACNNDGVWNDTPATFAFVLRPHFYDTYWFFGACGLLLAALAFGLHRWRVGGLKRREFELHRRVDERTVELSRANAELKREIAERERAEHEVARVHRELVAASHQAGMAEVATGVLHNVGNVLNSVNISLEIVSRTVTTSRQKLLRRVVEMLREHDGDLVNFLTNDPKGRQLPEYLEKIVVVTSSEQDTLLKEVQELRYNVEHIREIVATQQQYARIGSVAEPTNLSELVEEALRINAATLGRSGVQVVRDFDAATPMVTVPRHQVLQILVNFIQNAEHACGASDRPDKVVRISLRPDPKGVRLEVADNGMGIAPEALEKLFTFGFTTRKNGHGFGLHTGALAAKELGGKITAHSDGPGRGAVFTLVLPTQPRAT